MMSAVARPTVLVLTSLLLNRATANSDDDDDESDEHLSYSVWIACGLFVVLFLLFDLLRTRMWWVYEPRLHHDSYRARTPHAPGRSAESRDRRPARARGADGGAAAAAERLDVAGAPGDGPGRPRRADGGAEASGAAVTYRVKSDFSQHYLRAYS